MTQYRLMTEHYIDDQLLAPGTIVGDDTPYPFQDRQGNLMPPSLGMEGVDEASQRKIDDHYNDYSKNPQLPEGPPQQNADPLADMTRNVPKPELSPGPNAPDALPGDNARKPLKNEVPNVPTFVETDKGLARVSPQQESTFEQDSTTTRVVSPSETSKETAPAADPQTKPSIKL